MPTLHDRAYKKLFSNKTFFRELLQTFVPEKWVKDIDFDHCFQPKRRRIMRRNNSIYLEKKGLFENSKIIGFKQSWDNLLVIKKINLDNINLSEVIATK